MTPIELTIILLITFLAVTIIYWTVKPKEEARPIITVIVLLVSVLYVLGLKLIVARNGG